MTPRDRRWVVAAFVLALPYDITRCDACDHAGELSANLARIGRADIPRGTGPAGVETHRGRYEVLDDSQGGSWVERGDEVVYLVDHTRRVTLRPGLLCSMEARWRGRTIRRRYRPGARLCRTRILRDATLDVRTVTAWFERGALRVVVEGRAGAGPGVAVRYRFVAPAPTGGPMLR